MRWVLIVGGVLISLSGLLWTLQGLGVVGGSAMSGSVTWAIIGPVFVVVGALVARTGFRRRRGGP